MPTDKLYEETQSALEELEEKVGAEYPEVAETLGQASVQLEEAHGGMGEEDAGEEFPADLEGDEEGIEEDMGAGPIGDFPEDLEDEEEEVPPPA
jgi:hypothetical protein